MFSPIKTFAFQILLAVLEIRISLRPTNLEEDWEHFVDFSSILCLWLEIQGMRTHNFFWLSFKYSLLEYVPWSLIDSVGSSNGLMIQVMPWQQANT